MNQRRSAVKDSVFDKDLGDWSAWHDPQVCLRLGVSACLLGEETRFDGGHARNSFVVDVLGERVEWVPVCPEVGIGMGIPRPKIRLVEDEGHVRLVAPSTEEEFTGRMNSFAEKTVKELAKTGLDGYILKTASPSCGMESVKVYESVRCDGNVIRRDGVGLYAAVLMKRWPNLPVEEDARLNAPGIGENFIERIFCRNRWRTLVHGGLTRRRLVAFHTAHTLLLRSRNEAGCRRMDALVGSTSRIPNKELFASYEAELFRVMQTRATQKDT